MSARENTYRYFVSYSNMSGSTFGNDVLVYDEPLDTQAMIKRAERDLSNMHSLPTVKILWWKRIKDNRS